MNPTSEPNQTIPPAPKTESDQVMAATPASNTHIVAKSSAGKWLLWLLVIIILGAGGWFGYKWWHSRHQAKPAAAVVKHDIPLLRIATQDGPIDVFYPSQDSVFTNGFMDVSNQVFEGLVGWQGGTKVVPLLATSWANPNDSTWDFTLRAGVKFHSGRTMTAADVKYTLDNYKGAYSDTFGLNEVIKSVNVLSPNKVEIVTNGPDPLLLNRLTNFYIIDSRSTKPNDPINGTGPYMLKAGTDPTKDKVTDLVASDSYWGGHVYTRELQFSLLIKEEDEVAALKNHKIDLIDNFVDIPSIKQLKDSGIKMIPQSAPLVDMIALNTLRTGSPLTNLKFRQALNVGINRSAIIKAANVEGTPMGQYVTSAIPGYVPSITAPTQNVVQAKSLIAESGVKNPTITLSYGTDSSSQNMVEEIQKEAATFGVSVKLNPVDDLNVLVTDYQNGKVDMFFFANSTALIDATDVLSFFQMPGVYDNPSVDDVLKQANQTLDQTKRLMLLQQASMTLSNDVATIPLYTRTSFYAQAGGTYSLKLDVPGVNLGAYFWKVYQH